MASYSSAKKVTVSTLVFILSLVIFPYYIEGDQEVYREVYAYLPDFGLLDGHVFYTSKLSSREMVHFLLAWLASPYVSHDIFIAFFNGIFAYAILSLFQKWGASFPISVTIIFTNYYLLVLYFPAERLKFGFLFMTLSLINTDSKKFFLFVFLALVAHVQTVILYGSVLLSYLVKQAIRKKSSKLIYFLPLIFFYPLYLMSEQITLKYAAYSDNGGIFGVWKVVVFFILSMLYSKDKRETTLIFSALMVAAYLVGGERVNLYGYFVFLYYGLRFKGGKNYGVAITSVYYAYASLIFIANIIVYGTGFPNFQR
jgi:hypothetical protein